MAEKIVRPILTYADEFHHAVNEQYQRIVDYFKPKFLLGLTATPERMDGKISMKSAITMCHMRFH